MASFQVAQMTPGPTASAGPFYYHVVQYVFCLVYTRHTSL